MSFRLPNFSGKLIFNNASDHELTGSGFSVSISLLMMSLTLTSPTSVHAEVNSAESVIYKPKVAKSLKDVGTFIGAGKNTLEVNLAGVKPEQLPEKAGLLATGFVYSLPSPIMASQLTWELVNGVSVARIRILTEYAKRLRIHLTNLKNDSGIKIRLKGNADTEILPIVDSQLFSTGEAWLPLTKGNTVELEIIAADASKLSDLSIVFDKINLILVERNAIKNAAVSVPKKKGLALEAEYDVSCLTYASEYAGLKNSAAATALVNIVDQGFSYMCSGTLLTDRGQTFTPWFATANHCIDNQTVASTASFEWLYQAVSCGSTTTDSGYSYTNGGAQLLWSNTNYDVAFLKLNTAPTAGTIFSGWDNSEISPFDTVYGIHHPEGDHTMISTGWVLQLLQPVDTTSGNRLTLDNIQFLLGGIEKGSSGSGLFSKEGYWKGTLWGGSVYDYQDANYSPFRKYYDNIKPWLNSCKTPWGNSMTGGQSTVAYRDAQSTNCSAVAETRTCNDGVLSGSYANTSCTQIKTDNPCQLPWGGTINHGSSVEAYRDLDSGYCAAIKEVRACNNGTLSGAFTEDSCSTHGGDLILWNDKEGDEFHPADRYPFVWSDETGSNRKVNIAISKNSGKSWTSLKTGLKNTGEWNWKVTKNFISNKVRFRACVPKTKYLRAACDTSDFDIAIKKY